MAQARKILLNVSGGDGVNYTAWPVTFGVPFSDGDLQRGTPVRLVDEDGQTLPVQTKCLTTWNKDLKYARWLLIDTQTDLVAGEERKLFLECGKNPPAIEQPVRVDRQGDHLVIDTGPMRLEIRTNNPDVFGRCLLKSAEGWQDMFRGDSGPFLYMRDQFGNFYDSCTAGPAPRVSVEESGPMRACICIKGFHATAQGERFCPYVLRVHLFSGKSVLRIHHTFIYDQEPHQIELAAIGMHFPLNVGHNLKAAVGGAKHPHWATNWEMIQFLQSDDMHYSVSRDARDFGSGEKTLGWASLNGNFGGAAAVIRNCWQEYPKGFGITEDDIDVQIWPDACGEALAFTTPFEEKALIFGGADDVHLIRDEEEMKRLLAQQPTAPLNLKSLAVKTEEDLAWVEKMIEKHAPGRAASYNDTGTSNGVGAAKTTELYVRLKTSEIDDEEAESLARMVHEPLIAPADPAYTCATGAVGHFYHAGDSRFAKVDAGLDDVARIVAMEPTEICRLYGMMRYGNMVCSHGRDGPGLVYLHYKDTEPEKALRYVGPYNNEANDQIMAIWGNFLRTGRRDHFSLADNYSKNVADVGIVHAHPLNPNQVGLMHYHNAHQWSGGPSPSHTLLTGLLMSYYFTGNQRLLSVARETADRLVRTQEPAGIISCRHGVLYREFTGPLWSLMEAYQATWDEEYGSLAQRSLNWFLRALPKPGLYPNSIFTRGERGDEAVVQPPCTPPQGATDRYYLFLIALRLFDSKKLREQIIADADYWVWRNEAPSCGWNETMACLAYELTKDMCYAALCKDAVEHAFPESVAPVQRYERLNFGVISVGSSVPRLMRVAADAMDKEPEALATAEQEWRRKRREMEKKADPTRPDRGPETSLGTLSTEPLSKE